MSKVRTDFFILPILPKSSRPPVSAFGSRREKPRGERRSATGHTTATSGEQLKRSADQTPARLPLRSGARSLSCSIIMKRQGCIFHPAKPES